MFTRYTVTVFLLEKIIRGEKNWNLKLLLLLSLIEGFTIYVDDPPIIIEDSKTNEQKRMITISLFYFYDLRIAINTRL